MHLDVRYVYIRSFYYASSKVKTPYNLEWREEYLAIPPHTYIMPLGPANSLLFLSSCLPLKNLVPAPVVLMRTPCRLTFLDPCQYVMNIMCDCFMRIQQQHARNSHIGSKAQCCSFFFYSIPLLYYFNAEFNCQNIMFY